MLTDPQLGDLEFSVSEFVALLNQTLEYAYPNVVIVGELAEFKSWKDRLIFFKLKDDEAVVEFWGYASQLPGPLEDGMLLKVRAQPRHHPTRGFKLNVLHIQPAGEGSIRRAAQLLQAKLTAEGLFDPARKRALPYPPRRLGLITSKQSAAYADFVKVLQARWGGLEIQLIDVQVQGEAAPAQIFEAIAQFNASADPPEILALIRGGGSADDLAAFSTEQVTRAVAGSRVPTLVAIGHEIDLSLAELAADKRASTPSNAAELLVPDRRQVLAGLRDTTLRIEQLGNARLKIAKEQFHQTADSLHQSIGRLLETRALQLHAQRELLGALSPQAILRRGYAIVRQQKQLLRSVRQITPGAIVNIELTDGKFKAAIEPKGK